MTVIPAKTKLITMTTTQNTPPAIDLTAVSKSYGSHEALQQITVAIQPGEIFGLVGRRVEFSGRTQSAATRRRLPGRSQLLWFHECGR